MTTRKLIMIKKLYNDSLDENTDIMIIYNDYIYIIMIIYIYKTKLYTNILTFLNY